MLRNIGLILIFTAAAGATSAAPVITFLEQSVQIEKLTPGGAIAWMSVSIESDRGMNRLVPRNGSLVDTDGDGQAEIALDVAIALRSVWVVVDISNGEFAIVTPEGFESRVIAPDGLMGRARGVRQALDALEIERNEIELLVARPHVGAWHISAMEGSPQDRDGANDRVLTMRFADLKPLGVPGSAVPGTLKPGDLVIAIDPEDLSHFSAVIGR